MKIRLAAPLTIDSIVDGPGLRTVIWTQGCIHNCKGCHNPQTHDMEGGFLAEVEEIIGQIKASKLQKGITLSGGDPFLQARSLVPIAMAAKETGMDVWAYTGFKWEQLMNRKHPFHQDFIDLLEWTDVLVDGRFILEQKKQLLFRGSANQRIIDVGKSMEQKEIVLLEEYMEERG